MKLSIALQISLLSITLCGMTYPSTFYQRIKEAAAESAAKGIACGISVGCIGGAVATVYGLIASGYHAYRYKCTSDDLEKKKMMQDAKIALCGAVACTISTMITWTAAKEWQRSLHAHIEAGGIK